MSTDPSAVFTPDALARLFPADRADAFFEALFGDADEGSYDISLAYLGSGNGDLRFEFRLTQRPGKCLKCSLTYGLPQVFSRHPVIGVAKLAREAMTMVHGEGAEAAFTLGQTRTVNAALHAIPLTVRRAG